MRSQGIQRLDLVISSYTSQIPNASAQSFSVGYPTGTRVAWTFLVSSCTQPVLIYLAVLPSVANATPIIYGAIGVNLHDGGDNSIAPGN